MSRRRLHPPPATARPSVDRSGRPDDEGGQNLGPRRSRPVFVSGRRQAISPADSRANQPIHCGTLSRRTRPGSPSSVLNQPQERCPQVRPTGPTRCSSGGPPVAREGPARITGRGPRCATTGDARHRPLDETSRCFLLEPVLCARRSPVARPGESLSTVDVGSASVKRRGECEQGRCLADPGASSASLPSSRGFEQGRGRWQQP